MNIQPSFVVIHETATRAPNNPHATLGYNLTNPPGSSYHFLIARDGTIYMYVDPFKFISYHAGVNSKAFGVSGWFVNVYSIGIEFDGRNNGEPITPAQLAAGRRLAAWINKHFKIPLKRTHWLKHAEVAPRTPEGRIYKTDPESFDPSILLETLTASIPNRAGKVSEVPAPIHKFWVDSGGPWQPGKFALGLFDRAVGGKYIFERGGLRLNGDGTIDALLLSEIPND